MGAAAPGWAAAQEPASRADTLPPAVAAAGTAAPVDPWRAGVGRIVVDGEVLRRSGETHLLAALAGRVPGLEAMRTSGEAGSAAAVRLRGARSFAGGGPLIVVDGLPVGGAAHSTWSGNVTALGGTVGTDRAADVDLDDVESVEVLQGPAAAARYGARGGGGVVLVTTRRGEAGRTTYTLRSSAGLDRAAGSVPMQQAFGLGTLGQSTACTTPNCVVAGNGFSWGPRLAGGAPAYDHAAELFETGATFDNTLAVSGGNRRTTFYASGGALSQDGYFTGGGDTYDRYTVRLNAAHRLRDDLALGANVALVRSGGRYAPRAGSPGDLLQAAFRTPPDFDNREYLTPAGLHRAFRFPNPQPGAELASRGTDNPFYLLNEGEYTQDVSRVFGSFGAAWRPLERLRMDYTLGVDDYADDRLESRPLQSSGAPAGGTVGSWGLEETSLRHTLGIATDFALGSAVAGTVAAGHELARSRFRNVREVRPGRGGPLLSREGPAAGSGVALEDRLTRTLNGSFLQGTVGLAGQLFLLGTVRSDAVSTAGEGSHRAWYPGAGVTWSFARTLRIPAGLANTGNLRLAYGRAGQEPEPYLLQDLTLFAPPPQRTSAGVNVFSRADFRGGAGPRPATTAEAEAGVDLGLFGGRADLGVTYFRADSRDVVLYLPQSSPSASFARAENAGEIRNSGWEVTLAARPYTGRRVSVALGLNWARTRNEVVGLGAGVGVLPYPFEAASFAGSRSVAEVGLPLGVVRGFDFARCGRGLTTIRTGGVTHDVGAACQGAADGALFVAPDGFPIRDPNERVIADPTSDWTGGLTAEVRVLGARLGALVETRQGGEALNLTRAFMYQWGTHGDTEARGSQVTFGLDYMRGPVVGSRLDRVVMLDESWFSSLGGAAGPRAQFVEDASATRLREVSLAYTFDRPWLRRTLGLRAVDARVAGRNLFTWTDYSGFDPETGVGGAVLPNRGIDWFVNPQSRAWVLSVSLTR